MAESQFTKRKIKFFVVILLLVAIFAVATGVGIHFYFGHYFEASDISDSLADQLTIGSSFTINDILESEKYSYGWMKSDINVEVLVDNPSFDENADDPKEEKYTVSQDVLGYDAGTRTFTVLGIGSGIIDFRNPLDSSVGLQVPFSTKFAIDDTELILEENYPEFFDDGLIVKDEIDSVDELRFTAPRSYNVGEFFMCPNLYRFVLSSEDLLQLDGLENIDKNVMFYVTDGLYGEYMLSSHWANYRERVFPIVDLSAGKHTLVFEFKGGQMASVGTDDTRYFSSVDDGGKINLNDYIVERTGYTFLGWYTSNDNGAALTQTRIHEDYVFQADTKLYADWSANEYEIVYHDSYVPEVPDSQKIKYDQQSEISNIILERTGYTFIGWSLTEGATTVDFVPGKSIKNLTAENGAKIDLYAVWAANAYTIIYDGNGSGVINVPARQADIPFDTEVTISDTIPVWTGHTFIGWSTNKNAADYEYEPGQKVKNLVSDSNGQVVLYAIWSANTYSIKYDANGGSNAPTTQENLVYGEDVKISSVIPTWTGRVFLGWAKQSNAATASYLAGSTVSNLVADAGGIVTLYAVWAMDTFRIEYDANGGTDAPAASTYIEYDSTNGEKITSGKPNKTGYTFTGWSYAKDNRVDFTSDHSLTTIEINNMYSRASGTPKVVKLYACWSAYPITIKEVSDNRTNIKESRDITVTVDFASGSRYSYSVIDNNNHINISSATGSNNTATFKFSVSRGDKGATGTITITVTDIYSQASYSNNYNYTTDGGCFVAGTLITMGDGSQKKIEDIQVGDMVLTWNFITGEPESMPVSQYYLLQDDTADVLTLHFSDNTQITIVYSHGFFDYTLNEFVFIDCENYKDYLGHEFIKYDNQKIESATLVSVEYRVEEREFYAIVTACNYNAFAESFMSLTKPFIDGIFTYFEVGEGLMYDKDKMQADIDTYGLYTYEEALVLIQSWGFDVFPYEYFLAVNVQYYKILLGKGIVTVNDIIFLITEMIAHG